MSEAFVWRDLRSRPLDPQRELLALREAAVAEGRRSGHAEGLEEGRAAARAELDTMRVSLRDALREVDARVTRFSELQAADLAELLHGLCRRILGAELRTNGAAFEALLGEALGRLDGDAAQIEAFLNPEDHAVIAAAYQGPVVLHADAGVAPACVSVRLPGRAADFQPMKLLDELFAAAAADEGPDDPSD